MQHLLKWNNLPGQRNTQHLFVIKHYGKSHDTQYVSFVTSSGTERAGSDKTLRVLRGERGLILCPSLYTDKPDVILNHSY